MLFDPFELDTSVTPARVRAALRQQDFTRAILMAFRLNERSLLQETLESVPWDQGERRAGRHVGPRPCAPFLPRWGGLRGVSVVSSSPCSRGGQLLAS